MQLVRDPHQFDVMLCDNMFGDIISDEAAMLTGSMGMLASASLNSDKFGLFEPAGGSAPDIAGQGHRQPHCPDSLRCHDAAYSLGLDEAAAAIEAAVAAILDKKIMTRRHRHPWTVAPVSTDSMGDAIVQATLTPVRKARMIGRKNIILIANRSSPDLAARWPWSWTSR